MNYQAVEPRVNTFIIIIKYISNSVIKSSSINLFCMSKYRPIMYYGCKWFHFTLRQCFEICIFTYIFLRDSHEILKCIENNVWSLLEFGNSRVSSRTVSERRIPKGQESVDAHDLSWILSRGSNELALPKAFKWVSMLQSGMKWHPQRWLRKSWSMLAEGVWTEPVGASGWSSWVRWGEDARYPSSRTQQEWLHIYSQVLWVPTDFWVWNEWLESASE